MKLKLEWRDPGGWENFGEGPPVMIDGVEKARINRRETVTLDLPAQPATLQVGTGWGQPTQRVDLSPEQVSQAFLLTHEPRDFSWGMALGYCALFLAFFATMAVVRTASGSLLIATPFIAVAVSWFPLLAWSVRQRIDGRLALITLDNALVSYLIGGGLVASVAGLLFLELKTEFVDDGLLNFIFGVALIAWICAHIWWMSKGHGAVRRLARKT